MSIAAQALVLRENLRSWAEERGGVAEVVANFRAMWEQASQSSQKPMLLVCFLGERVRGPFSTAAATYRVDRTWNVAVVRGRGFASNRGDTLTEAVGDAPALFDVLEEIRDRIRTFKDISAEAPVDFKGIKPMQLGSLVIDGYLIEFSTAHDLSQPT